MTRLRDVLLPVLRSRFARMEIRFGTPPEPIAVFAAAHPQVGEVSVFDAGEEARVHIGRIAHAHFCGLPKADTEREQLENTTEDVVDFLAELFSDRVVLHESTDGRTGGWKRLAAYERPIATEGMRLYRWSGPVT